MAADQGVGAADRGPDEAGHADAPRGAPGGTGPADRRDRAGAVRFTYPRTLGGRAAGRRPADRGGRDGRDRRRDRRRQVHGDEAARPVLRPGHRPRTRRRLRPARPGPAGFRASWATCRRRASCSPERSATTSPTAGPSQSDAEVEAAARAVGAHDFVAALPGGYLHELAERGRSLSAGQRQLIALARAELVDPAVLLLDEATSNLDLVTEARVAAAMRRRVPRPDHGRHRAPVADGQHGRPDRGPRPRPGSRDPVRTRSCWPSADATRPCGGRSSWAAPPSIPALSGGRRIASDLRWSHGQVLRRAPDEPAAEGHRPGHRHRAQRRSDRVPDGLVFRAGCPVGQQGRAGPDQVDSAS